MAFRDVPQEQREESTSLVGMFFLSPNGWRGLVEKTVGPEHYLAQLYSTVDGGAVEKKVFTLHQAADPNWSWFDKQERWVEASRNLDRANVKRSNSEPANDNERDELRANVEAVVATLRTAFENNPPGRQGVNRETIRSELGVSMGKANAAVNDAIKQGLARYDKTEGGAVYVKPASSRLTPEELQLFGLFDFEVTGAVELAKQYIIDWQAAGSKQEELPGLVSKLRQPQFTSECRSIALAVSNATGLTPAQLGLRVEVDES